MGNRPEQVARCRHSRSKRAGSYRTYAKQQATRKRRRAEKIDPEGAPTKPRYLGYAD